MLPAPAGSRPRSPAPPGARDPLLDLMCAVIDHPSSQGIAIGVSDLIRDGSIAPGSRLPTVRATAAGLHVSATTVNDAWRLLAREGLVRSAGRNGTMVLRSRSRALSSLSASAHWMVGRYRTDLSSGAPDVRLLPELGPALAAVSRTAGVLGYGVEHTIPALEAWVRETWAPVLDPEEILVTDGAFDAIDRVLRDLVRLGDHVLVENPTLPTLLDTIVGHGGVPVPVAVDAQGIRPDDLVRALRTRPIAAVIQPRAQNPTGVSTTPHRMAELGAIFAHSSIVVVEDDHTAGVATAPHVSLHRWHPSRTLHVQSFSKSHGPDLRLAVVGGPRSLLAQVQRRRVMGPGWSSRLLQQVLLTLLTDPATIAAVDRAREVYAARRTALQHAVAEHGLTSTGTDGLNLWVRVRSENEALRRLADAEIGIAPGSPFRLGPSDTQHVRVTSAALSTGTDEIARLLAGPTHHRGAR
ncbi:MAG TPA: aminotransferase class I/II-fold pyridoxal phosphate-dependent enzyme [Cellulomonas sp.]